MISFTSVAVVAAIALVAPLVPGLTGLGVPAIVLEILLGIAVGPHVLGWAKIDEPSAVMSMAGLAFLLLLAGLEIDFKRLRGKLRRLVPSRDPAVALRPRECVVPKLEARLGRPAT